jgi:hypothetical protein
MAFSFHKYWNYNDDDHTICIGSKRKVQYPYLAGRNRKIPMYGLQSLFNCLDKHNIGYAFWPMKKIDNIAGITNVKITPEYQNY